MPRVPVAIASIHRKEVVFLQYEGVLWLYSERTTLARAVAAPLRHVFSESAMEIAVKYTLFVVGSLFISAVMLTTANAREGTPMKISGSYTPKKWDEKPYEVIEGRMKATKVSAEFSFVGGMEGTASVEYLMFYKEFDSADPHRAAAQYVGLMRFVGKLNGKFGSFAMTDNGTYKSGAAISKISIVSGSGTGELSKITGSGTYRADQSGCSWELEIPL